jgi:hypothetical protein
MMRSVAALASLATFSRASSRHVVGYPVFARSLTIRGGANDDDDNTPVYTKLSEPAPGSRTYSKWMFELSFPRLTLSSLSLQNE